MRGNSRWQRRPLVPIRRLLLSGHGLQSQRQLGPRHRRLYSRHRARSTERLRLQQSGLRLQSQRGLDTAPSPSCSRHRARSVETDRPHRLQQSGIAYSKTGRLGLAHADFEKVLELKPDDQHAKDALARLGRQQAPEPSKGNTIVATGTGFIIDDRGDVVTNNHVVDGCSRISFGLNGQGLVQGRLIASDGTNDLAVANFPLPHTTVASFSNTINSRPGDDLVVFGYPLVGLLSTSGNLTRGSLTAMAGVMYATCKSQPPYSQETRLRSSRRTHRCA